jgi:GntR family transcriptional regulator
VPLPFLVNPSATVPIFRQIADGLRGAIGKGTYAPGELLPSVRQVAEELRVNPNTVHKAFAELEREGLIASERGKGMAVKSGRRSQARAAGDDAVLAHLIEAARLAESSGISDERFQQLVRRAQRAASVAQSGVLS